MLIGHRKTVWFEFGKNCILLLDVWFELYSHRFGFSFRSKLGWDESAMRISTQLRYLGALTNLLGFDHISSLYSSITLSIHFLNEDACFLFKKKFSSFCKH